MKNFSPWTKRIAAFVLAAAMLVTSSACGKKGGDTSSTSQPGSSATSSSSEAPSKPERPHQEPVAPSKEAADKLNEKIAINEDVVGWLRVPDTEVDEEILQGPAKADGFDVLKDGEFYERRDINKAYNWYGCYFADYESTVGNRNEMSDIVTIYGHSMDDDPDSDKFSKLKRYKEQKFAEEHPYFYLTTPDDDMTFKVFAVLYTDWKNLPYYYPNEAALKSASEKNKDIKLTTIKGIIDEMKNRSLFDYDVEVDDTDKLVVLSTCTYLYGNTKEEKEQYRFLVVGRLLRPDEDASAATIKLSENTDAKKATDA
ncbi:MAG: class B sortase [Oscillospiraceae bacterium]|nr:class B sortase [Oscillospiraceae bacterium]MCI9364682.1 class B sortase [Oscillospiraceae bacterium]MCI9669499.1 class B sortase [Oscillospiraceae bacterium]